MAQLVLHVGSHKTGTTYLQNLFHHNRDLLAKAGIYYPDIGPNTAHHVLASPWLTMTDVPDTFFDSRGPDGLWDDLIDRYAKAPGTVFLSGENFSRAYPKTVDMTELAERLSAFEEVRVLYAMRAQTETIQSLWLQLAKSGNHLGLYSYVRNAIEQRRAIGVWIDHNTFYNALLKGFAPEQIYFLDYGQCLNTQGGIAQVILDLLEVDLHIDDLVAPRQDEANISPDPLSFWIASKINEPQVPRPNLLAAVTQPLTETRRPNTLLARHEYIKISTRYGASNTKLVDRLQTAQPGFTFQEVTAPDDMIYREEIPDPVWLDITRNVYALQRPAPASTALERTRQGLSRLMQSRKKP